jgi:uncharacterized protein (UPF0335 family)
MTNFSGISGTHLRQIIDKIERLEEQKAGIANDIREVYAEAKAHGFDVKIIRKIISMRRMDQEELAEHEELLTLYMNALNLASTSSRQGISEADAMEEAA